MKHIFRITGSFSDGSIYKLFDPEKFVEFCQNIATEQSLSLHANPNVCYFQVQIEFIFEKGDDGIIPKKEIKKEDDD